MEATHTQQAINNSNIGWTCPKCGRTNSPYIQTCPCYNDDKKNIQGDFGYPSYPTHPPHPNFPQPLPSDVPSPLPPDVIGPFVDEGKALTPFFKDSKGNPIIPDEEWRENINKQYSPLFDKLNESHK